MYKNDSIDKKVLQRSNNLDGPAIRNIYLRKASEEYNVENIPKSIFYQVEVLCLTLHFKYSVKVKEDVDSEYYNLKNSFSFKNNELYDSAKSMLEQTKSANNQESLYNKDPIEGYQRILEFCGELPGEWTVIHLCKEFNPATSYSLHSEIQSREDSIFLTVLKYPSIEKSKMKPFCIRLKNSGSNVFYQFINVISIWKSKIRFDGKDTKENRYKFWDGLNLVDKDIMELIENFKKFIGPWICLFTGEIRCSKKHENISSSLCDIVNNFSLTYKLNDEKRNILNVIVRRANLLSESYLKEISQYLARNNEKNIDLILYEKLYEFLNEIKKKYAFNEFEYLPCILIIDEFIDHFFWEMLNPNQEFCRISSLHIFKKLFKNYKSRIYQGYVQISVKSGNYIINPDKTLDKMEQRMSVFFKYWLSHWKSLIGEIPTSSNFLDLLQTGDCFVYCGHGSGLQFLDGQRITKLYTESIVFLYGCDSVCLKSDGLHSEMSGSHIYYHAALCPAVIGYLIPALDYQLDCSSTLVLSMWIPSSKRKAHWLHLDKNAWQKGKNVAESNMSKFSGPEFEPRLTKILALIRSDEYNAFYNKIGIVLRGLPVWNCNSNKN